MKIGNAKINAFLANPGSDLRAALFYGPDQGLVRERADLIAKGIVDNPADPFRNCFLSAAMIKENPNLLFDEAASLSMTAGPRIVRIQDANDSQTALFKQLLENQEPLSLVLAEAGELRPRSPLRQLFENQEKAAAVGCYLDDAQALDSLIHEICATNNLSITQEATQYLIKNLGANRLVSRRELEKLVLYAGSSQKITEMDASAVIGDNGETTISTLAIDILDGNNEQVVRSLSRLKLEGVGDIQIIRGSLRHLHRLHLVVTRLVAGENVTLAINSFRPPLHFSIRDKVKAQAHLWPLEKLQKAMKILLEAEIVCKQQSKLTSLVTYMAILSISNAGRKLKSER